MNHAAKMAREDFITEALRAADAAIGDEQPTPQAMRIIEAIKRLRAPKAVRVPHSDPIDYLARLQSAARRRWLELHKDKAEAIGPAIDATAWIPTPIGTFAMVCWRVSKNGRYGRRITWAGEYWLDDKPITVAEIKAAGLAQRPTTRRRNRK